MDTLQVSLIFLKRRRAILGFEKAANHDGKGQREHVCDG